MSKPPRRIPNAAPGKHPPPPARAAQSPSPKDLTASALLDCFAIAAPGLEQLVMAEAVALGLPAVVPEGGGGVEWRGDLKSVLRANLGLRIASRVVVRLAQFEATSFAELEKQARRIAWHRVIPAGSAVRFRVTCKKSRLYHSDAVAQRVADAIVRALPGTRAEGASGSAADEDEAVGEDSQLIVIRLFHDQCTVSADSSGALLHRRGYRQAVARGPLRETIAAALLAASGWDGVAPLVDPLCGSGTISIEAAMIARRMLPGAARSFAVERWPGMSRATSLRMRADLASAALPRAPGAIRGSDRDTGAIVSAAENAERAGVVNDIEFSARVISGLRLPDGPPGWLVTNPPYGVRVGDSDRVRDLWAQLGHVLRDRAQGWRIALLSPDPALERQLRLPLSVAGTTSNGGIPVRIVVGEVALGASVGFGAREGERDRNRARGRRDE